MNFKILSLLTLLNIPALAMDFSGQDHTAAQSKAAKRLHAAQQHVAARRVVLCKRLITKEREQAEKDRDKQAVSMLAQAFSQLPKNKNQSEKEKKDFHAMLAERLPIELQERIAEFQGKSNDEYIKKHVKELIPSVVTKHAYYPSMRELVEDASKKLNEYFNAPHQPLIEREKPYIIAAAGFLSFHDEPSKFRFSWGSRGFASDIMAWLLVYYAVPVKPLADNEWLGVLYSDGSIQWHLNAANMARLSKEFTKEQLILGVALWDRPDILKDAQLEAYRELPKHMIDAVKSNYEISSSQPARYIRKGLKGALTLGALSASALWTYCVMASTPAASDVPSLPLKVLYAAKVTILGPAPLGLFCLHTIKKVDKNGRDVFRSEEGSSNDVALSLSIVFASTIAGGYFGTK